MLHSDKITLRFCLQSCQLAGEHLTIQRDHEPGHVSRVVYKVVVNAGQTAPERNVKYENIAQMNIELLSPCMSERQPGAAGKIPPGMQSGT